MKTYLVVLRQSRTILILVALMVALLISSLASLAGVASAAETKKVTKPSSYLLLYSDKGLYKKAVIYSSSDLKCGSKKVSSTKAITVGLSKGKDKQGRYLGVKLKCDPGAYNVYFLKSGEKLAEAKASATLRYASVGLSDGHCAFVHRKGVTRNQAVVNNRCVGDDDPNEDTTEKFTPVMTATTNPATITQGKKFTLLVEVKHPDGRALSVEECAGSFTTSRPITGSTAKNNQGEYPLRYNKKAKACQYKRNISSSTTKKMASGVYVASFKGNAFLNPVQTEYRETVVPSAKGTTTAKKESSKVTKSKGNTATKKAKIKSSKLDRTSATTASLTLLVTGVEDCNRINLSVSQKISGKTKEAKKDAKSVRPNATNGSVSRQADGTCVLVHNVSYNSKLKKSSLSFKSSFKAGTKTVSKSSNKITLGN